MNPSFPDSATTCDDALALEQEATQKHIALYHRSLPFGKAVTMEYRGAYGIFLDDERMESSKEYRQVLCHELGHCATGTTHGLSSPWDLTARHEERANRWSYGRLLPPQAIQQAINQGDCTPWQLAERFSLSEDFVRKAIDYYTNAKGIRFSAPGF